MRSDGADHDDRIQAGPRVCDGRHALLVLASIAAAAGQLAAEVTVDHGVLELPSWQAQPIHAIDPGHPRAFAARVAGSERLTGTRRLATIVLANEHLEITVLPEVGGHLAAVVDRHSGEDLFFREGWIKDWVPYWESGLKVSFPFREHGIATADQAVGWRILRHDDGAVTLAMWMEFARFDAHYERWIYGRYSDQFLSQHLTLRPGETTFTATWRLTNPVLFKQGRRLWSDAIFPRQHGPAGVVHGDVPAGPRTQSEWVFPAATVSSHSGRDMRSFENRTALADYDRTTSIFAWDLARGFTALYYPQVDVNRFVVFDHLVAPGAKLWFNGEEPQVAPDEYFKYKLVEFWGGSDHVFEAVEHWLQPGETWQFTQRFGMLRGIGRVDLVTDDLAVALDTEDHTLRLVALRPLADCALHWDDQLLAEGQDWAAGEARRFPLATGTGSGRLRCTSGGRVLLDDLLPLPVVADPAVPELAARVCNQEPVQLERNGNNTHFGESYRAAIAAYPAGSLGRGRLLYRDGYLPAAGRVLRAVVDRDEVGEETAEAWHLLGASLLEQGEHGEATDCFRRALAAEPPYHGAAQPLAILALAAGDAQEAAAVLDGLVERCPAHWEGRLLRTAVLGLHLGRGDRARAMLQTLEAKDPADPRVAWLRRRLALPADAEDSQAVLDGLLREPGASERLRQFQDATEGRWSPPRRLGY